MVFVVGDRRGPHSGWSRPAQCHLAVPGGGRQSWGSPWPRSGSIIDYDLNFCGGRPIPMVVHRSHVEEVSGGTTQVAKR